MRLGRTLRSWLATLCAVSLNGATGPTPATEPLNEGDPVDVAPWAERATWDEGRAVGLWWEDPRDIARVVVTFAAAPPDSSRPRLQWWQSHWPEHRIPRDRPAGAGESGWLHLGDTYQGKWRDADATLETGARVWSYTLRPVNAKEFPALKDFPAPYRTTLRLRLLFPGPAPAIERIQAFTDSVWRKLRCEVLWDPELEVVTGWPQSAKAPAAAEADRVAWSQARAQARFEVFNGWARETALRIGSEVLSAETPLTEAQQRGLTAQQTAIWLTRSPNVNTFDRTVVTVRAGPGTFSFDPEELAAGRPVFALGSGALVRPGWGADGTEYTRAKRRAAADSPELLYNRIAAEPEQSLERATAEQPRKGRFYMPLGTEGGRQRFGVNPDGSAFCVNDRIDHPTGRDTPRRTWGGNRLDFGFDLPRSDPTRRWLEGESLPILHTEWEHEGIRYTQTAFVTRLDAGGLGFPDMQADDTAVLMIRIAGKNLASEYRPAHVRLSLRVDGRPVALVSREGRLYAKPDGTERLRLVAEGQGQANQPEPDGQVTYFGNMPPGTDGALIVKIPFITLDRSEDLARLADLEFEGEFARVRKFWKARVDQGTRITTPVPDLNRFYRAHLTHLLINCGREVGADRLAARVGGFAYGVYGNESCMMITDLDRRGFHREAERCLETFLEYQGTVALPGDYATRAGVFNGANGWEQGGYNQHHGWILWAMAEHYWFSGDRAWLERNANKLIGGCRWIATERARTRALTGLRQIERGLLPPGSLEDIGDWRCWMSNNTFSWWGLDAVARALVDIGHPAGPELLAEAEAFQRDILAAFTEASRRAPLVPLRNGAWIPQFPAEVHRRGRAFGWITVTLEGPIYFVRTGLLPPDDPRAPGILMDYEENLYLSERYGYSWEKHKDHWFSRGGISMQPNLLCSPHGYLLLGETKHFLRAYFNAFAACFYPDTCLMAEHPLPDLGDWRGDHFKTSDEANSTLWLRLMFVDDRPGQLRLGSALPRAWLAPGLNPAIERAPTRFGPLSLRYESQAAAGRIDAVLDPPTRHAPAEVEIHFRHPEGKPVRRVEVNGQPSDRTVLGADSVRLPTPRERAVVTAWY
jgi:hypothetical protein